MKLRDESGAGTVIALGMISALLLLGGMAISAGEVGSEQTRLQVLADTIAIASSDAMQGLTAALPCESAQDLSRMSLVDLRECLIVGQSVHISLAEKSLGIVLNARAIAEPMH